MRDRGEGCVVQVVRIRHTVAIPVAAELAPGGRDELERAHGAVPGRIAVKLAVVGVGDRLRAARPIEGATADGRLDIAIVSQVVVGVDPAVTRLDLRDAGHDCPVDLA